MTDTIFALSSGAPPAAIAVVRISGPHALASVEALARRRFEPRYATLATLRDGATVLDQALVLTFPGAASATGEDVAELHLHGGRATVAAVLAALSRQEGLRQAEPGEFTRRAFANGRLDLTEAEGLADLLAAETEAQRRSAQAMSEGGLSRLIEDWRLRLIDASARVEAAIDYAEEDDVQPWPDREAALSALADEMRQALGSPPAERLRDGFRVVLAGPPNAGKSSLLNALAGRDAAIVSNEPGTTRDRLEVPLRLGDFAFVFTDTAGLRDATTDALEREGMARAERAMAEADLILWLGREEARPSESLLLAAKSDLGDAKDGLPVSVVSPDGLRALKAKLIEWAAQQMRKDRLALSLRQRTALTEASAALAGAAVSDLLIAAEYLRLGRSVLDRLQGRQGVEQVLDALFARFCLGK